MRPCTCDNAAAGQPRDEAGCLQCWYWHNSPTYRLMWEREAERAALAAAPGPAPTPEEARAAGGCGGCAAAVRARAEAAARAAHRAAHPDEIRLNMGAGGIGDGLQGLLAVAAVSAANPGREVVYRVSPLALPFVGLFTGYTRAEPHDWDQSGSADLQTGDVQLNAGYNDEVKSRGARPRIERYCANAGVAGPGVVALRDPTTVRQLGAAYAGWVAVCPFSAHADREWALPAWAELVRLLKKAGYKTLAVHAGKREFGGCDAELVGAAAAQVAGALLNCACVVGLDSGLVHLAGLLNVPAVAIMGQTSGRGVFGCYPSVRALDAPFACAGCYWQTPFSDACKPRCPAMAATTPTKILAAVDELCLPPAAGGLSVIAADRLAVLRDAVIEARGLPGELLEAGAYRGGSARLICTYAPDKSLHVFDALGLPEDDADPEGIHKAGDFAATETELRAALAGTRATLYPGVFPGTAAALHPLTRFALAHLDLDTYQATKAALEYVWPRLVPGGLLVLDDLDWGCCPGVRKALGEVLPGIKDGKPTCFQGVVRKPATGEHTAAGAYAALAAAHAAGAETATVEMTNYYGEAGEGGAPGVLEGVRLFLKARPEWTVVAADEAGCGSATLSRRDEDKARPPGLLRRALNFSRALARHAADGGRDVPEEVWEARTALCLVCQHRNVKVCGLCGCPCDEKAHWASEACPDDPPRWTRHELPVV